MTEYRGLDEEGQNSKRDTFIKTKSHERNVCSKAYARKANTRIGNAEE